MLPLYVVFNSPTYGLDSTDNGAKKIQMMLLANTLLMISKQSPSFVSGLFLSLDLPAFSHSENII